MRARERTVYKDLKKHLAGDINTFEKMKTYLCKLISQYSTKVFKYAKTVL